MNARCIIRDLNRYPQDVNIEGVEHFEYRSLEEMEITAVSRVIMFEEKQYLFTFTTKDFAPWAVTVPSNF